MKKIQRLSLNELEETCTLLSDYSQTSILGGGEENITINISGGTLKEINGGVQYTGSDGSTCYFSGVSLSTKSPEGTAYQYGGTIHIDEKWSSFDVNDFAHEYGHYIQEQEMGTFAYTFYVGVRSAFDVMWGNFLDSIGVSHKDHSARSYEVDATKKGDDYLKDNMHTPEAEE